MQRPEGDSEERIPLLNSPSSESTPILGSSPKVRSDSLKVLAIAIVCFIVIFGEYAFEIPGTRILEDIICRHYYEDIANNGGNVAPKGKIDEKLCKGEEVQSEMAIVIAGIQFLSPLPCLALSFYYGSLADRIGRKRVLLLVILGDVLYKAWVSMVLWFSGTFPVRLVWIGPLFFVIGGGEAVAQNMIFAMVSDITTEATRANSFFLIVCGSQVAALISPAVSAYLMSISPWISRLMAFPVITSGVLLLCFIPETLHISHDSAPPSDGFSSDSTPQPVLTRKPSWQSSFKSHVRSTVTKIRHTPHILPISFVLFVTILQSPNKQILDFSIRYISKRFDWPLAKTSYLVSVRAAVNIIVLLLILPFLSRVLTSTSTSQTRRHISFSLRRNLSSQHKDLFLARMAIIFLVAGTILSVFSAFRSVFALGLAIAGMMVFTLGTALPSMCRSLLTSLVKAQQVGRLFAIIAIVETIGSLLCAPALAGLYSIGLKRAKVDRANGKSGQLGWLGLPFWAVTAWIILIGSCLWFVRLQGPSREEDSAHVSVEEAEFLEERVLGDHNH